MNHSPTGPRRRGLVTAVAVAVLATAAGAEAQAAGRPLGEYQVDIVRAVAGQGGMTATQARAANALMDRVLAIVRANPAATASPASMCMRLRTHPYLAGEGGRVAVEVDLSFPIVVDGQCYGLTTSALRIRVNDLSPLLRPMRTGAGDREPEAGEETMFQPLVPMASPSPHPRYGSFVLLHRAGEAPFLPLPKERYLRTLERDWAAAGAATEADFRSADGELGDAYARWTGGERARFVREQEQALAEAAPYLTAAQLAEMRQNMREALTAADEGIRLMSAEFAAHAPGLVEGAEGTVGGYLQRVRAELAALPEAERRMPTCLDEESVLFSAGPASCPVHRQPVMANPGYWKRGLPPEVAQAILVELGDLSGSGEGDPESAARRALQREIAGRLAATLDYVALEALIR